MSNIYSINIEEFPFVLPQETPRERRMPEFLPACYRGSRQNRKIREAFWKSLFLYKSKLIGHKEWKLGMPRKKGVKFSPAQLGLPRAYEESTLIELDHSFIDDLKYFDKADAMLSSPFASTRVGEKEDYPAKLLKYMDQKEPQFILRNIGRVERMESEMEFNESAVRDRAYEEELKSARMKRHQAPPMLEEWSIFYVEEGLERHRKIVHTYDWSDLLGLEDVDALQLRRDRRMWQLYHRTEKYPQAK